MNGEDQSVVTDEPVELEKTVVDVQDFRRNIDHFRRICGINLKQTNKNQKMSTCDQLDLETLGC